MAAGRFLGTAFILSFGVALLSGLAPAQAQEGFKPELKKAQVNGQPFYETGAKELKTLQLDSSGPASIECEFVNGGEAPAAKQACVSLRFAGEKGKSSGDYMPSKPTLAWGKGEGSADRKTLNLAKFKGQKVAVYVGLFLKAEDGVRLPLSNAGAGEDGQFLAGYLQVK